MNPETAGRVQESWATLRSREGRLAGVFYERLFELDGELRDLFVLTDLEAMREKLVMTLDLIVDQLTDTGRLSTRLEAAARSHALYGIGRREYRLGGEALLWGLERELGPAFTDEVRAAWAEAYTLLAELMLRGGESRTRAVATASRPR